MTRLTSTECYKTIHASGLLSEKRFKVYNALYRNGPMTQIETCRLLKAPTNVITPRFAELRDRGVIYEVRTRPCKITGRNVIEWAVTNNLPSKPLKRKQDLVVFNHGKESILITNGMANNGNTILLGYGDKVNLTEFNLFKEKPKAT